MRYFYTTGVLALGLAMTIAAGCSSPKKMEAAMARIGDETPPDFVTGPAMAPFKDYDGFSADVVETTSTGNGAPVASGELIGRQGRLIFQPWTTANVKKAKYVRGGMSFIWDISSRDGYVLSEALQAYAPIFAAAGVTNQTPVTQDPPSEIVNGHPCHRQQLILALSDGTSARLTEWLADDLRRFPVRVQAESAGREITVDFSNIRLDIPGQELFNPPADFTKYPSAMALINELMIRESAYRTGPSGPMANPVETSEPPMAAPAANHN